MARIELDPGVGADLGCIPEHLARHEVDDTPVRVQQIIQTISVLEWNPLIGRPTRGELRELVIGRRSRGDVALYRYVADLDVVEEVKG